MVIVMVMVMVIVMSMSIGMFMAVGMVMAIVIVVMVVHTTAHSTLPQNQSNNKFAYGKIKIRSSFYLHLYQYEK